MRNCASVATEVKVGVMNRKLVEQQGLRDLFVRLLSTLEKIDLEVVHNYPPTPVPLSDTFWDRKYGWMDGWM